VPLAEGPLAAADAKPAVARLVTNSETIKAYTIFFIE
jgi:hypothetical protein